VTSAGAGYGGAFAGGDGGEPRLVIARMLLVGPGRYCPLDHPTHFESSFFDVRRKVTTDVLAVRIGGAVVGWFGVSGAACAHHFPLEVEGLLNELSCAQLPMT